MPLRREIQLQEIEIVTDRLTLRPNSIIDLEPITREFNERITCYMTPPAARSSLNVAPFIADSMEGLNNNTNLQLTAVNRKQGTVARIHWLSQTQSSRNPHTRTRHLYHRKICRQGLWLETTEALYAWVATEVDCDYLTYLVDRPN